MAVQMHQRGMIEEAESVYNDVLSVVPDQADAIHYLGVIAHQMGDSPKGVSLIKKSLAVNPKQPDALNNLGNIYRELGRLDEAKSAYNKVLELAPGHADAWVNVGVILRQLSNPEDALEKIERGAATKPTESGSTSTHRSRFTMRASNVTCESGAVLNDRGSEVGFGRLADAR